MRKDDTPTMANNTSLEVIKALADLDQFSLEKALSQFKEPELTIIKAAVIKYKARRSPMEFAEYASGGAWKRAPHFKLLNDIFIDACVNTRFVVVNLPVRHGKSEFMSKYALAWYLGRFPNKKVIIASYGLDSSSRLSQDVRDIFKQTSEDIFDGVKISRTSSSKKSFLIDGHKGGLFATGVGSKITGFGGDLIIMDDLYKDMAQATSKKYEEDLRNWWLGSVRTRLQPGASVILVLARWNEDISSWLLERAKEIVGSDPWVQIKMQAICEDPDNDPLGRNYGEALWPDSWPVEELTRVKISSPLIWSCQYQQETLDFSNAMFPFKNWNYIETGNFNNIQLTHVVRAWDLSAGGPNSDYLAGVLMGIDRDGIIYIIDVKNKKFTDDGAQLQIKNFLTQTSREDRERFPDVIIRFEQAPGAGKSVAEDHLRTTFAGFSVEAVPKTGADRSKIAHALPLSSQQQAQNCYIVKRSTPDGIGESYTWTEDFIQQMLYFPNVPHDDQVDAASLAYKILSDLYHDHSGDSSPAKIISPVHAQTQIKSSKLFENGATVPLDQLPEFKARRKGRIISLRKI